MPIQPDPVTAIVGFVLLIGVIVVVHEYGHYLAGRLFGAAIDSFAVGFGPTLVSRADKRGTLWKINALPLGGFVSFVGEQGTETSERQASLPGRRYPQLSPYERIGVAVAGPFANFLFAAIVFAGFALANGVSVERLQVDGVQTGSPAEAAGFQPGDVLISAEGQTLRTFNDLSSLTQLSAGTAIDIEVERAGAPVILSVTPERRTVMNELGIEAEVGMIGIELQRVSVEVRDVGPVEALGEGVTRTVDTTALMIRALWRVATGRESIEQMAGPVGIADLAGRVVKTQTGVEDRSALETVMAAGLALLAFSAVLSVGVGLFNLLPLPVLDGGHVVFCTIEALQGRPVSEKVQQAAFSLSVVLLVGFALVVTVNDIQRILSS